MSPLKQLPTLPPGVYGLNQWEVNLFQIHISLVLSPLRALANASRAVNETKVNMYMYSTTATIMKPGDNKFGAASTRQKQLSIWTIYHTRRKDNMESVLQTIK